ncbi:MAG TPA: urate hydroxylase PuuD [Herbaspirillum sp.]|nr:urate hydroxylase PuuD [Herbaspirillum sp.]
MEGYLFEWCNILLRWLHVITGIAWIGASFYFVWLDNSLERPTDPALLEKGVGGELWAVHGGGFYNPQKYVVAPETLPKHLHWFYWESYSSWLSGFALFSVLYLFNANTYLIDRNVMQIPAAAAIAAALAFLVLGWVFYDVICRCFGDRENGERIVGPLVTLYVVAAVWVACHVFAGRAAFLLAGAMMATIMSANVLFWIIPGQRKVIASMRAGQPPDPIHGKRGKQRSVHNTYFTLPVIFAMLSNHYSMMYEAANNWLVLLLMMLAGVLIREFFLLRHKAIVDWRYPGAAVAILIGVGFWLAPAPVAAPLASAGNTAVSFAQVQQIIGERCLQCHAAQPTLMPAPGKNIVLDSKALILQHAQQIYQQAVIQKTMPLANMTHITDQERALIGAWFTEGADAK